jgi:hypothetical protein
LLVDDDLLLPENICRNELSWAGVGIHKAEAVREALSLVAPDLEIGVRIHRIAGQESAVAAAALKDLAACDLLVEATANAEVFLRLAAVARMAKRPLCWGEVFAGGLGGLIARARPGIDPNPVAIRNAILNYLETQPLAPYRQAGGYDIEGQVPVIATDSDVTLIAGRYHDLFWTRCCTRRKASIPIRCICLDSGMSGYFHNHSIRSQSPSRDLAGTTGHRRLTKYA